LSPTSLQPGIQSVLNKARHCLPETFWWHLTSTPTTRTTDLAFWLCSWGAGATCCVHIVRMVGGVYFPLGGSGQGGCDGAGWCQLQPWLPTAPRPAHKAFLIRPWVSLLELHSSVWQTPLLLLLNLHPTCPWPPRPIPLYQKAHGLPWAWGLMCFPSAS